MAAPLSNAGLSTVRPGTLRPILREATASSRWCVPACSMVALRPHRRMQRARAVNREGAARVAVPFYRARPRTLSCRRGKGDTMATYAMLSHWTDRGIQDIKNVGGRIDAFKKTARSVGVEVRDCYMTLGEYDTLTLVQAPDDEAIAKL